MRSIVVALDDMYTLLYQAPMFLTDDQELRFRTLVLDFGRPYTRLRELSRRSGVFGFSVTPKVHKVQHLPLLARCINPTRVQVYSEESMMGVVTKTWMGVSPRPIQAACAEDRFDQKADWAVVAV